MRCWVEVSREQLARNYRSVKAAAGAVEVMPVVKADAYRHGAVEVSRVMEAEGVRWLAVSNVEEGIVLRQSGIRCRILVMADTVAAGRTAWKEYGLTPVVHDLADIGQLSGVPYHLKVDTGMGRMGTREPAEEVARAVAGTALEGVMTHFAASADFESRQTRDQLMAFRGVLRALEAGGVKPRYVHASSTNPLHFGIRQAWGDIVRPGFSLYGYTSAGRGEPPERVLEVQPALQWKASILLVKEVPEGAPLGYGAMFRAPRPMRVAIVGAGYADGLPHRLSNKGRVIAAGKISPILGAVSMDVITVDVTHAAHLKPGDAVTLLGREGDAAIDAQQMARAAGTIAYSVLCGISARVRRVFV
ncbi:MAG: alanine racemase [Acidobacteria bacterium]|nr:alanine racemase [Acidobacteriota bacterium]